MAKKFMYLNRKAPYGTVYALESLEVVLIAAAFDQEVTLAFLDDGVYQIAKDQNPKALGMKNFSATYNALGDYGITKFYVEQESLAERGLSADDLMPIVYEDEDDDYTEKPSVQVISRAEMTQIMAQQDVTFSF